VSSEYKWRPITEMHEDDGECVVINLLDGDPGCMEIHHVCDLEFDAGEWTHFVRVPSLTTEDAERLLAEYIAMHEAPHATD
jgi:hypothetical protein